MLWAGKANSNRTVIYQGSGNDLGTVLAQVLSATGNGNLQVTPIVPPVRTFILHKYVTGDLNLDGNAIYQGNSNDLGIVLGTVLQHPANTSGVNSAPVRTFIVSEQNPITTGRYPAPDPNRLESGDLTTFITTMTDMTTLSPCTSRFRAVRAFWLTLILLTGFSLMGIGLNAAHAQDGVRYSIKLLPDGVTYQVSMKPNVTITQDFEQQTNSAQVTILAAPNALSMVVNTASFTALNGTNWNLQIVRNPTVPVSPGSSSTMLAGNDYFIVGLTNNGVPIPYTARGRNALFQFKNLLACAGPLKIWESNDRFVPNPPSQPINVGNDLTVYGIDFATSNAWLGNYDLDLADCSSITALPTVALISPPAGTTVSGPTIPVSGTATPGSSVTVGENGIVLCSTTATAGGSFSCSIPLSDGPHTLTAVAQDPNGTSDPTPPTTFSVYTPVVPVPPTLGVTTPGTAGTTTTTPTLSGTVTPDALVVLTGPGPVTLCSTAATANGSWSCTLGSLPAGPKSITVTAYKGGLPSIPSVVDLFIAPAPTVAINSPATNTTQPVGTNVVSGTATPGALVDLSDGRGPLCSTTATISGAWSCSGLSFPVGVYSLTALAQNEGGSSPAVNSFSVVLPTSPSNSTCLVEYKIALQPDGKTYRVSMRTNVNFSNPNDVVNSAQVTVIAPHGSLRPVSVTSITGTWAYNTTIVSPTENPGSDYFIFGLTSNGVSMPFVNGLETPLFDFVTTGDCTGGLALMEANDPFRVPNSQNINSGNEITVYGYQVDADGNNLPDNAWCANYDLGQAACQALPTIAISSPQNTTTSTTPVIAGTATPRDRIIDLTGPTGVTLCSTTATSSGDWSCTVTVPAGPNTLTATACLTTGCSTTTTTFTAVAPPTVGILTLVEGGTATTTPTISGTATPLASVTVLGPNSQSCVTTASASGTYACSSIIFPVGPNSVTVIARNPGGTSAPVIRGFIVLPAQPMLVSVPVRAFLQGALTRPGSITASLMRDDLRRKGLIPTTEPYTGFNYVHVGGGSSMSIANPSAVFSGNGSQCNYRLGNG